MSLLVGYGNKFKLVSWLAGGVMSEWALQDAKNRFSAVVNAALAGKPQTVTRRGTPAVVVVAVEDYKRLCQAEKDRAPTFVEHLLAFPQGGEEIERMPLEARPLDI
ncbi:MAG: type II toxin-antitoxin system Phd/YefM family antitoxin [Caldilineaceae bacterium]|nr:type II toxin-antitoxin system Phd/YefM family antitoxin [Caldilineaceae bacterium]